MKSKTDIRTKSMWVTTAVTGGTTFPEDIVASWQVPADIRIIGFELMVEGDMPASPALDEGVSVGFTIISRGGKGMPDSRFGVVGCYLMYWTEIVAAAQLGGMSGELQREIVVMYPEGKYESVDRDDVINLLGSYSNSILSAGDITYVSQCVIYYYEP